MWSLKITHRQSAPLSLTRLSNCLNQIGKEEEFREAATSFEPPYNRFLRAAFVFCQESLCKSVLCLQSGTLVVKEAQTNFVHNYFKRERKFSIEPGSITNAAAWTNGNLQLRSRKRIEGSKSLRENIKGDGRIQPNLPNSTFSERKPR